MFLIDNALNAVGGTQTIPLSGTGNASGGGSVVLAVLKVGPDGVPRGYVVPNAVSPADSSGYAKVWVDTVHQTMINGFVFLQVNSQGQPTCSLYSQANVTAGPQPQFGTLYFRTVSYTLGGGQCPGILFPFRVARYTWGVKQSAEQDPFVLQVRDQYGVYLNEYGFTATLAHIMMTPAPQSGSPTLASQIANLVNPPAGATGYTWTISSTIPSITLQETHSTGSYVPFSISVEVATAGGPLEYGPTDAAFGQCLAQLMYRSVPLTTQNHAFWWVQDSFGTHYIVDGGPTVSCSLLTLNCGYLDGWVSIGDAGTYPGYPADNFSDSTWYSSQASVSVCSQVEKLLNYAYAWPQTSLNYNPFGPNSNTFAWDLSDAGNFPATAPPRTVGWGW
jgi:hypothetical protein